MRKKRKINLIILILAIILLIFILLLFFVFFKKDSTCQIDDNCNIDDKGDCANVPSNPDNWIADHPGCICKENQCVEAPCEPPCELG